LPANGLDAGLQQRRILGYLCSGRVVYVRATGALRLAYAGAFVLILVGICKRVLCVLLNCFVAPIAAPWSMWATPSEREIMHKNTPPIHRTTRLRFTLLFWVALTFALLILAMGSPAWAAPDNGEWQQGTVPLPPPTATPVSGGGGNTGGGSSSPAATATPALPTVTPSAPITNATVLSLGVPANETGIVIAPRLNMRGGAGVSFPVVGRVVQSQTVTIQFRDETGDWWYTCCGTDTVTSGWVSARFIQPTSFDIANAATVLPVASDVAVVSDVAALAPAVTPAPIGAGDGLLGTVSPARLNLREEPSTQGAILGKLLQGQVVQVNSRNEDGSWWYVCCVADANGFDASGWASAAFIEPGFARADAAALLPVFEQVTVVLPTPTPRPGTVPTVEPTIEATTTLQMAIVQKPEFVLPGALFTLHYVITNTGDAPATAVELRNELTPTLSLVGGEAGADGRLRQSKTAEGRTVVAATWPTLASGGVVTATIAFSVAPDMAMGEIIENIAAVSAQNAAAQTSGARIGMPPASLPDFQ
jgi:hypothetical protein